jgi:hypothetical protein
MPHLMSVNFMWECDMLLKIELNMPVKLFYTVHQYYNKPFKLTRKHYWMKPIIYCNLK